jgi:hypothetical protein
MKDIAYPNPDDHLYVWESCLDAFWYQVRTPAIIELGMGRLQTWWKAVERRQKFQFDAKKKLGHQLDRAKQVLSWYCKQGATYVPIVELLQARIEDLELKSSNPWKLNVEESLAYCCRRIMAFLGQSHAGVASLRNLEWALTSSDRIMTSSASLSALPT